MATQSTIVFDLDGTLADTIHDLVAALNRTLAAHGLPPFTPSDVAYLTGKGGLRAMIAHAFSLADRQPKQRDLEHMFDVTVRDYDQNIAVQTTLYSGVENALKAFKSNGWLLAVCTNKPIAQTQKLLGRLNIDGFFDAVAGADSFEFKKPDPKHLIQTIEMAGGCIKQAVMVGDTQTDIFAAKNANVPVVAVDFGYSDVHVKTFAPDRVISNFDALYAEAAALLA